jgi:hypothetical protein
VASSFSALSILAGSSPGPIEFELLYLLVIVPVHCGSQDAGALESDCLPGRRHNTVFRPGIFVLAQWLTIQPPVEQE